MEKNENSLANNQIEEIYVILNELKNKQECLLEQMQKNYKELMKKLMKIQEFNKIQDMSNQIFEMRLSNIEDFLFILENYIRSKYN